MSTKIQPSASGFVSTGRGVENSPQAPAQKPQNASLPQTQGFSNVSNFVPKSDRQSLALDGAPKFPAAGRGTTFSAGQLNAFTTTNVSLEFAGDVSRAGHAGGTTYDDTTEFGHALASASTQFGAYGADKVQHVVDQLANHQPPSPLSTAVPQPGDIMVWGAEGGDGSTPQDVLGKADGAGHMAVVENVVDNHDGTVTLEVSERNWDDRDEETRRFITLKVNPENGSVIMPDGETELSSLGVGFIPLNNPRPGPNPTLNDPNFMGNRWRPDMANTEDGWVECMGYVHDLPGYGPIIDAMAGGRTDFNASSIVPNSTTPQAGGLMVWGANSGGGEVPQAYGKGHVAYVEDVQINRDPPGDPNGRIASYTLTISEANAKGNNPDEVTLRTFTVSADQNGQIVLPANVGFYNPAGGVPAPSVPSAGSAPAPGTPITGNSYTVQAGDTLGDIASRAGVSLEALAAANGITNVDFINEGQNLVIPR